MRVEEAAGVLAAIGRLMNLVEALEQRDRERVDTEVRHTAEIGRLRKALEDAGIPLPEASVPAPTPTPNGQEAVEPAKG